MKSLLSSVRFAIITSATVVVSLLFTQTTQAQQNFSHTAAYIQIQKDPSFKLPQASKINEVFITEAARPVFEGGEQAWILFLKENLRYPEEALAFNIWGDVEVGFTVERDGAVKYVHIISGVLALQAEAKRIIMLSNGKWKAAHQNGYHIAYRQTQKICFRLSISE